MKLIKVLLVGCLLFPLEGISQLSVKDSLQKAIRSLYTPDYLQLKDRLLKEFKNAKPGKFGEFVPGSEEDLVTRKKIMAFTFDACGGKSSDYNAALIGFLQKENIPATLFITGLWINSNKATFLQLAKDTLFEIENHGLNHRLCSIDGETKYGVIATKNVGDVIDEMELNNRKIEQLIGRRPKYFRSAAAWTDETCTKIAGQLGMEVVSFDILSGDAVPYTPASVIADNIVKNAKDGAIIIMHFNHPKWYEKEALEIAVPKLRELGYTFGKLDKFRLRNKK
jgi:peptidoglycan/xylan/chitin deacetylase (PgdA/CDA1 family)